MEGVAQGDEHPALLRQEVPRRAAAGVGQGAAHLLAAAGALGLGDRRRAGRPGVAGPDGRGQGGDEGGTGLAADGVRVCQLAVNAGPLGGPGRAAGVAPRAGDAERADPHQRAVGLAVLVRLVAAQGPPRRAAPTARPP